MNSEDRPHPETDVAAPVGGGPTYSNSGKRPPSGVKLRPAGGAPQAVKCVACDAYNPTSNLHCEYCGARLSHRPLPNSQPKYDSDAAKILMVAAVSIAVVIVGVGLVWMANKGDAPAASTPVADPENGNTRSQPPPSGFAKPQQISPEGVTASSEHSGFPAGNLIDGNSASAWLDDSLGGRGAELTFTLGEQKTLLSVTLTGIEDPTQFHRNFRIREFEIRSSTSDEPVIGRLVDEPGPQTVQLPGWVTTQVRLKVLTTYVAAPTGDQPGTQDLALNEVTFTEQTPPGG